MPAVPSTPQANSPKDRDPPHGGDRELEDGIYYIVNNAGRDAGQAEVYISRPRSRDTPGGDGTMQVQVLGSMADSDKWRVTKSKSRNGETVYLLENKYDTVSERYGKLVGIPRDNNGGSGSSPWRETRWKITRSRDRWGNEQKWTIEKASWRSDDVSLGWSVTMTGPRGVVFHNYQVNCVELEKVPREIIDSTNFMFRPA